MEKIHYEYIVVADSICTERKKNKKKLRSN